MRNAVAAIPLALGLLGGVALPSNTMSTVSGLPASVAASRFAVHFLDVGTGDSAIIDIGETEIVVDGGDSGSVLTDYVARTRIIDGPIELVVVTHGDIDHWRGLTRLLGFDGKNPNPSTVTQFWEPGFNRDCRPSVGYDTFIENVEKLPDLLFRRPLQGLHAPALQSGVVKTIKVPGVQDLELRLLHSTSDPPANSDCAYRINNASIVFEASIFNHRFLFTGDANGKERDEDSPGTPGHVEKLLLDFDTAHPGTLKADVLKAPHHGSDTASTQAFIDRIDPDFIIISSSVKHELPKDSVLKRYANGQRVILKTDLDRKSNLDHIICFEDESRELECNFTTALENNN